MVIPYRHTTRCLGTGAAFTLCQSTHKSIMVEGIPHDMANSLFPSIIPSDDSYDAMSIVRETDAWVLQGIAAAHPNDAINGQSSAVEIAGWVCGNHTTAEIDGMVSIIEDSEPPRSDVDLSPALNQDGNLSMY